MAGRRALLLAPVILAAVIGLVLYHQPILSYLTHWRGGPHDTWTPAPIPGDPLLRIAATGDIGDGGETIYVTATTMYEFGLDRPYDMLYLLGDNVYPYGDPAKLEDRVFRPLRPVLDQGTELRAIMGNHDHLRGAAAEQLERLSMPGPWHAVERNGVLLVGLDTELVDDPEQRAWLEDVLTTSTARWKIVAMHCPPYSAGYQGSDEAVRDAFVPLLSRHGVQLVLSGHDHDYQRSKPLDGVTYVVSGAGASSRRTGTADFTDVAFATEHFVDIAIYADHLLLRAIDTEGRVFDRATVAL